MDSHQSNGNGGNGSARIYDSTVQLEASGGEGREPRQDSEPGRVGTFDAMAEERSKNVEALGRTVQSLSDMGLSVAAGSSVDAWQRQLADFWGMRQRKNFAYGTRFAQVNGITDLVALQQQYVSDTLLDYASRFWSFYGTAGFGLRGPQQSTERLER